jgi:acyl carrier protein
MTDRARIVEAVFAALDEVDALRPGGPPVPRSEDTLLFGENGTLESLELVTLIVGTETNVERAFGKAVTIADERAMSRTNSPFRSVRSLVEYVEALLRERS